MFDFRRAFRPTKEEQEENRRRYMEVCQKAVERKACCTCVHHISVSGYHPGFVTGADEDCDLGRCPIETCEDYELDSVDLINESRFL